MSENKEQTRFGFVAVMGPPNAGKSTLVNALCGAKISIVSPKVQTTRTRVRGIVTDGDTQFVFTDTPGLFAPDKKNNLEQAIVKNAWEGLNDADLVYFIVDASRKITPAWRETLQKFKNKKPPPVFLILNKVDKTNKETLLEKAQTYSDLFPFEAVFMLSATGGTGIADLVTATKEKLPYGPFHYDADALTDMPDRLMAAEITREKLFLNLRDELPYGLTVETDIWERFNNGDLKIEQTIYIARDAHKKIILGAKGAMIKKVGQAARTELSDLLNCTVHLKLFVKVQENWMSDRERFEQWGL